MKTLAIILLALSFNVSAGLSCTKDWKGDTVCTQTQTYQGGNYQYTPPKTFTGSKDWKGETVWQGSDGSRSTCTYDWKGAYVCN